ncbi:MAG TPA: hypothetical protein VL020_04935 [Pseudomonadales bacterium]|nr:hypothetical protein [Pseudomonadales bacterium]
MTKLLTEQELRDKLCMKLSYDDGLKGRQAVMLLGSDIQDIVEIVQSQKLAHAAELQEELLDFARDVLNQYGYEGRPGGMSTLEWAESIINAAEQRERNKL